MNGWTVIYTDAFPPAVELRRAVLDEHQIPAVVLNKRDSSYLFGFVELLVQEADADVRKPSLARTRRREALMTHHEGDPHQNGDGIGVWHYRHCFGFNGSMEQRLALDFGFLAGCS